MADNNEKMDIVDFYINLGEEVFGAEARKQEWKDWQEKQKKEEDPIECYCYDIRGEMADYEITYEENKQNEATKVRTLIALEKRKIEDERQPPKPAGMTNLQWQKEMRNKKRLLAEKKQQGRSDRNLKQNITPLQLFSKRLDKISCRCEAEEMRAGRFCDTCRLIVKINEYTLDLFKRASQGRTSYI
jgi:hypothetical protein